MCWRSETEMALVGKLSRLAKIMAVSNIARKSRKLSDVSALTRLRRCPWSHSVAEPQALGFQPSALGCWRLTFGFAGSRRAREIVAELVVRTLRWGDKLKHVLHPWCRTCFSLSNRVRSMPQRTSQWRAFGYAGSRRADRAKSSRTGTDKTKTCFIRVHPCPSVANLSVRSWPCV